MQVPVALLSRANEDWQFEAEGLPDEHWRDAVPRALAAVVGGGPFDQIEEVSGRRWTVILLGTVWIREWALLVPGTTEFWRGLKYFDRFVADLGQTLKEVAVRENEVRACVSARHLYAFGRRLSRDMATSATHNLVLRTVARQVEARTGALAVYSTTERALAITATYGYPHSIVEDIRIAQGEGIIGRSFETGRAQILDASALPRVRRLRYVTDSFLIVPVRAGGRSLAVLALTDRSDGQVFDTRDLDVARRFAAMAALAFTREPLREAVVELTRVATVDSLTGLFNRRYFEERLEAEVQRAHRQQTALAVLMIDIDDFKRINDTLGHLEGDRTLKNVVDQLRGGVRIFDVCARYGGEEFVIIMPGATSTIAMQVAERIRRYVQEQSYAPRRITVSIGVGLLGYGSSNGETLIAAADRALRAAKAAGKNVVWINEISPPVD
jgi:diguanylate cyclase (GGDEF)-like protein